MTGVGHELLLLVTLYSDWCWSRVIIAGHAVVTGAGHELLLLVTLYSDWCWSRVIIAGHAVVIGVVKIKTLVSS